MTDPATTAGGRTGIGRRLKVRSIRRIGFGIKEFELVDPSGASLPPFSAGAHVHVTAPGGVARPYSLCNDPAETMRYRVAVLRESHGRGGSKAMHDKVAIGHELEVSEPTNDFQLDEAQAAHHLLIAGGIGATPLLAMAHRLRALGRSFEVHYCVHAPDRLAFLADFQHLTSPDQLHVHVSHGDASQRMDVAQVLSRAPDAQIYCCGPPGLIQAVKEECSSRPGSALHYEQFKVELPQDATAFEVELARSGRVVRVPDNESILVALWRAGYPRPFSCEVGICGACRTRYLAGEPEHLDRLLTEEERRQELLICISRSCSPRLVLDL